MLENFMWGQIAILRTGPVCSVMTNKGAPPSKLQSFASMFSDVHPKTYCNINKNYFKMQTGLIKYYKKTNEAKDLFITSILLEDLICVTGAVNLVTIPSLSKAGYVYA